MKTELYINDTLVDLDDNVSIPITFQGEDLTNPTAIKNSWSKTVSLPATPLNNDLFNHIWRLDHLILDFNPSKRVSFILLANGAVIESGYIKLNSINYSGQQPKNYNITLYGGLGEFFYCISNKDMNDLGFKYDHFINRETIQKTWGQVLPPWSYALTYSGMYDNFDNSKVLSHFSGGGISEVITDGVYLPSSGNVLFVTYHNAVLLNPSTGEILVWKNVFDSLVSRVMYDENGYIIAYGVGGAGYYYISENSSSFDDWEFVDVVSITGAAGYVYGVATVANNSTTNYKYFCLIGSTTINGCGLARSTGIDYSTYNLHTLETSSGSLLYRMTSVSSLHVEVLPLNDGVVYFYTGLRNTSTNNYETRFTYGDSPGALGRRSTILTTPVMHTWAQSLNSSAGVRFDIVCQNGSYYSASVVTDNSAPSMTFLRTFTNVTSVTKFDYRYRVNIFNAYNIIRYSQYGIYRIAGARDEDIGVSGTQSYYPGVTGWAYTAYVGAFSNTPADIDISATALGVSATDSGSSWIFYNAVIDQIDGEDVESLNEHQRNEFRSYYQRPILRVRNLFEQILVESGYTYILDSGFFNDSNPYWNETYIIQDRLSVDKDQLPENRVGNIRSGDRVTYEMMIGKGVSQFEFLISYCKMFGIFIIQDKVDKSLRFIQREDYFAEYEVLDWTEKIDYSKNMSVNPLAFDFRTGVIKYDDAGSKYEEQYKEAYNREYGRLSFDTGYRFDDKEKTFLETVFQNVVYSREYDKFFAGRYSDAYADNKILPALFTRSGDQMSYNESSYHLVFWNGMATLEKPITLSDDNSRMLDISLYMWTDAATDISTTNRIPNITALWSNGTNVVNSLYFARPEKLYYIGGVGYPDDISIYDLYHKKYYTERCNENNKVLTAYFYLNSIDINQFQFNRFVVIENSLWFINKINDYDLTRQGSTKVELVKVTDMEAYKSMHSLTKIP